MITQIVKFRSPLDSQGVEDVANSRINQFRAIPGLAQKYYVQLDEPGYFMGIYIWESREALAAFRESDLAKTIPAAYQIAAAPEITTGDIMMPLRG